MAKKASKNPLKHLRTSDVRGIAQLAIQATTGVTNIVEGVHQSVCDTAIAPGNSTPNPIRDITKLVYSSVRGVTQLSGKSVDLALFAAQHLSDSTTNASPGTPQRAVALAALNGVMGDRLVADKNPLAIPMTLRYRGAPVNLEDPEPLPAASSKVLVLIHGLCMNDLQWRTQGETNGIEHGEALASTLGYTPIYVRYNSGLHTSQNGRTLSVQLEQLLADWPTPIEELTVVAHSMGGLITRSALFYARQRSMHWPDYLRNIVFLGTPHHGAPLERIGNWLDGVLGSTSYTAPFAALGQVRSAGITDLRYGHVLDADWLSHDRFHRQPDSRQHVPLPEEVACFAVAATTASKRSALANHLIGDGLVPLHSALGLHDEPLRTLHFAHDAQWIGYRMNHMALLSSPDVTRQMVQWLAQT